jgi:[methyl-Co(III) methanol-specific corrinoid protein]:coenzyme M methyltransferase
MRAQKYFKGTIGIIRFSDLDMKNLSPKERVLGALLGKKIDRIPASSVAGCGGTVCVDMQKSAGIYWPDAHKDAEKMAKLAIASYELTGLECVRVPFDFVIEPEALGCEIKYPPKVDAVPMVYEHIYQKPDDLKMPENILELGRIPILLEAIKILKEKVGNILPVSSLLLGPFTLVSEMVGASRLMIWCLRKPDYVKEFVEFATDFLIEFGKAQYDAGSDIVEVGDPVASPDLIRPSMFNDFAKPALIKLSDRLKGIKVLHICGNSQLIVTDMSECGYHGISIEEAVDIAKAKSVIGDVKILGNVSSKETLLFGNPEEVKAEAKKAIESGVDLLEPGCGIAPSTPLANVKAFVKAAKEFGWKRALD